MSGNKDRNNPHGTLEDMQKSLRGINNLKPISGSQNSTSTNLNNAQNNSNNGRKDNGNDR